MPLNRLYHEHGIAQMLAQRPGSLVLKSEQGAQADAILERFRPAQAEPTAAVAAGFDRFEVFRADEVQVSSTQFAGGDWRWRLLRAGGEVLVEGGGYHSRDECVAAVSCLRNRAAAASWSPKLERGYAA